jgi:hypothetical protein
MVNTTTYTATVGIPGADQSAGYRQTSGAALSLSSITSINDYIPLSHPDFPGYGIRMKKTEFCDSTVKSVVLTSGCGSQR